METGPASWTHLFVGKRPEHQTLPTLLVAVLDSVTVEDQVLEVVVAEGSEAAAAVDLVLWVVELHYGPSPKRLQELPVFGVGSPGSP